MPPELCCRAALSQGVHEVEGWEQGCAEGSGCGCPAQLCVLGAPGAGKRSLLRALAGQKVDIATGSAPVAGAGAGARTGGALTAVLRTPPAEQADGGKHCQPLLLFSVTQPHAHAGTC
jgi:hypothetical protein